MDGPILLLLLFLLNNGSNISSQDTIHTLKNYLNSIEINNNYTKEKIKIAKKVVPLLPIEYAVPINKSVLVTEKIVKILEAKEFINSYEVPRISELDLEPKERLQRIVYTVQEEVKSSKIDDLGMVLDLLLNMDRYKKMLSTFTSLMSNKNSLNDTNSISKLIDIFVEGSNEEEKEKINDMVKMFDILKLLNNNENKPNEA
ncbi:hypothetical protein [Tissierella sp. Yu-01]|uniref:hypothetical protein n=1 Tax=Tissierella sp. Yu-01 TaxID=3035694 RepID=UPI00240E2EB7|nr:hypothetical protein [Tissierella sp. Yu-01]WFA09431.1 hypothetical protein P3962_02320 [Tissierella sp. Yu-01]